jgi:hypothetical protein
VTGFIPQPGPRRLGEYLLEQLRSNEWSHFDAAIAFVKASGVRHIAAALREFSRRGTVRLSVGVDLGGTSIEGLQALMSAVEGDGGIWVFHNETHSTFHPKVYLFSNPSRASLVVGSSNLTEGGLYANYEASLESLLDLELPDDRAAYDRVCGTLDSWRDETGGTARRLTPDFLLELLAEGYIVPERLARPEVSAEADHEGEKAEEPARRRLFASAPTPGAPAVPRDGGHVAVPERAQPPGPARATRAAEGGEPVAADAADHLGYVMTLHATDVGYGQTTAGTEARSPEIFIPLAARDDDAGFWDWDYGYTPDPGRPDKKDRKVVLRLGADSVDATFYNWPDKHDFRIRTEALRRAATVGDILRLEKAVGLPYDYYAEIVPQGTTMHATYLALCVNAVRNSDKRWGYY